MNGKLKFYFVAICMITYFQLMYTYRRIKSTMFANHAHELLKAVMKRLAGISEGNCEILYHITHHVLSIMSLKVSKEHDDKVQVNLDKCDKPSNIAKTIGQWLLCVGYMKFGGMQLKNFEEEVHVSFIGKFKV